MQNDNDSASNPVIKMSYEGYSILNQEYNRYSYNRVEIYAK